MRDDDDDENADKSLSNDHTAMGAAIPRSGGDDIFGGGNGGDGGDGVKSLRSRWRLGTVRSVTVDGDPRVQVDGWEDIYVWDLCKVSLLECFYV